MLRGINVTGHNRVKMADLRELFEAMRFQNVETYIQSGNVVFKAPTKTARPLADSIRKRIAADLGLEVSVMIRTRAELKAVVAKNPFAKHKGAEGKKLNITFLERAPAKAAVEKAAEIKSGRDAFEFVGRELYVFTPDGYGKTKLSNTYFERVLKVAATTRNWKTVLALDKMASA